MATQKIRTIASKHQERLVPATRQANKSTTHARNLKARLRLHCIMILRLHPQDPADVQAPKNMEKSTQEPHQSRQEKRKGDCRASLGQKEDCNSSKSSQRDPKDPGPRASGNSQPETLAPKALII